MNASKDSAAGFEDRLLTELQRVVAANPTPPPVRARPAFARRWRRPLAVAGGLAAAAAAAVTVIGFGEEAGSTAWAVTPNDDGTVAVEINSLEDAEGLERKLREAGVPAVVLYLPEGKRCADPPEGAPYPAEFGWATAVPPTEELPGRMAYDAPWGSMTSEGGGEGFRFTIAADRPENKTLAITTHTVEPRGGPGPGPRIGESSVRVQYVKGDESPCVVVDATG